MQCVLHGALEFFNSARLLRHCFRGRGMLGPRVATSSEFASFHSIRRGVVCETMEITKQVLLEVYALGHSMLHLRGFELPVLQAGLVTVSGCLVPASHVRV